MLLGNWFHFYIYMASLLHNTSNVIKTIMLSIVRAISSYNHVKMENNLEMGNIFIFNYVIWLNHVLNLTIYSYIISHLGLSNNEYHFSLIFLYLSQSGLIILCIFTQQLYVAIIWCSATALIIFAHSTFNSNYTLKKNWNYVLQVCIKIKLFILQPDKEGF